MTADRDGFRALASMDDAALGDVLSRMGDSSLFPPTPDLVASIAARIRDERPVIRKRTKMLRRGQFAAAAVLIALSVGPFFFSSALRQAAAEFFGLPGVRIKVTQKDPGPSPSTVGPSFGREVSLAAAQKQVGFPIRVPGLLGAPDHIYLDELNTEAIVSLTFEPSPGFPEAAETGVGLLVMEFEGSVKDLFIKKVLGPQTTLELVDFEGKTAYWISGASHPIAYLGPEGDFNESPVRLAANTLLFSRVGVIYRIEGEMTLESALAVARSL